MSSPNPCVPCCSTPVVTNIPGSPGLEGPQGPQGEQGEPGEAASLDTVAGYGSGSAYALTITSALLNLGSTAPSITLADAGTYLLFAHARFDFNAATFAAVQTVTAKMRCVNNTIADVANSTKAFKMPIVTTITYTAGLYAPAPVAYVATAGDVIQLWGSVSVAPSAGSLDTVEADIFAVKIA